MNYSIDAGHNCTPDIGATGFKQEDVLTKEVVSKIIEKIRSLGCVITDCTPYGQSFGNVAGSLEFRCEKANSSGSQFHLCIHFNAGGGEGVEVYAVSSAAKEVAVKICSEIAALGYANRGIKDGSHLYVVNRTNMPCCLVECSFVDNQGDMNKYNADQIAEAIVKALTGQIAPKSQPIVQVQPEQTSPYSFRYLQNELNVQFSAGLVEDNIPGPITLSHCPLIKQGAQGNITKWIQTKLGINADGIFGNCTKVAVQNFQAKHGLSADGIVGQKTWRKLLGL